MKEKGLNEILDSSKTISDISRYIFGNSNYYKREKCKKILLENGIVWTEWLKSKKIKQKKYCLNCGKEIISKYTSKKFCNSSCAASFNNRGKIRNYKNGKHKQKYCLNCGRELKKNQKTFCSNVCQGEYKYKEYIRQWKLGEKDGMSGTNGISISIKRYLYEKYDNSCQLCGWNKINPYTNKVPLQIHHIDGDCTNNKEENLQLLCPNCHSLTENYGSNGKHVSKRVDRRTKYFKIEMENDNEKNIEDVSRCIMCGKKLDKGQTTFCSHKCCEKNRIKNITKEEILNIFNNEENISYTKAAKLLNISTTCLTNKCEKFGIKSEITKIRFGK